MSELKNYKKKTIQPMRPFVLGEDLTDVSVSVEDTPEEGGMIAVGADNDARWYVSKIFFEDNYELADEEPIVESLTNKNFGQALAVLKDGGKVAREGWNGKDQWVMVQFPDGNSKMTEPYFYLKNAQGGIIPWLPSQGDTFAEDWIDVG